VDYGIYPDKESIPLEKLKHLDAQRRVIRRDLDAAISKERKAGLSHSDAITHYVKEVSFTYLNRLAALRTLEVRKIIPEVLVKKREFGAKSYGHRNWVEVLGELCAGEPDEGLSSFLSAIFDEISEEIKILFDTTNEYSLLFPSHVALSQVIQFLVDGIEEEVWKEDEIIGWIYQYFIEKEKDDIFEKLFKEKKKIAGKDIAVVTQLFTPKWIVEWIVDNSLGVLWQEMKAGKRSKKLVSEIRLLDPACGSGHFMLTAFDYFKRMYEEEGVIPSQEIPLAILKNNLFGIDIDLRAIQLSALSLYVKVKTIDKNLSVRDINLVCADAILLNGEKRKELLRKAYQNKALREVIDNIWSCLQNIHEYGSLLRVEKEIHSIIELKTTSIPQSQRVLVGWDSLETDILKLLREIAKESLVTDDVAGKMFASEAEKGLHLLDYFMQQYDVVVTNPPYMGNRGMNDALKTFLATFYPDSNLDLYSAFIERCLDFATQGGLVGMVTQQTFMFISSYANLRKLILRQCKIRSLIHIGTHAFEEIKGEKVSNSMFIFEKTAFSEASNENIGLFVRVVKDKNKEKSMFEAMKAGEVNKVFYVNQAEFQNIQGYPFIYWMPVSLRRAFATEPPLEKFADIKTGMNTGDNERFVRFWWEVGSSVKKWVPYVKGAGFSSYFADIPNVLDWNEDEIRKVPGSAIRNKGYYFEEGLTFTLVSTGGFSCRYLPSCCIFDMGSPGIFPTKISMFYLLGLLNSRVCRFLLKALNPTINVQVGDICRIPIKQPKSNEASCIETYAKECVEIVRKKVNSSELSKEYKGPFAIGSANELSIADTYRLRAENQELLEVLLDNYKRIIDREVSALYALSRADEELITQELGESPIQFPVLSAHASLLHIFPKELIRNVILSGQDAISEQELIRKVRNLYLNERLSITQISQKLGVHSYSVYLAKLALKTNRQTDLQEFCDEILSYFMASIFGRFELPGISKDSNGIAPRDPLFADDILLGLRHCFEIVFGEKHAFAKEKEIEEILGKKIEDWLVTEFYEGHYRKYRKRPIIWHLKSEKGFFHCFIYYHKLTTQTLHTIIGVYLPKKLDYIHERLRKVSEELTNAQRNFDKQNERNLRTLMATIQEELEDIEQFDRDLKQIIESGYKPDFDLGVYANLKPLEKLLPIKVDK
jgi:type I restriction-modification system DNA methylase subunit